MKIIKDINPYEFFTNIIHIIEQDDNTLYHLFEEFCNVSLEKNNIKYLEQLYKNIDSDIFKKIYSYLLITYKEKFNTYRYFRLFKNSNGMVIYPVENSDTVSMLLLTRNNDEYVSKYQYMKLNNGLSIIKEPQYLFDLGDKKLLSMFLDYDICND